MDATHDPALQSWVSQANGHPEFPIQNLPFGVFRRSGSQGAYRIGVAIGDRILDLHAAVDAGIFQPLPDTTRNACRSMTLNALMALPRSERRALRRALSDALSTSSTAIASLQRCLVSQANAEHAVPADIGDYTDFYTSIHHATNIGRLFRPDNPLLPNYKWVPIGYHGRSSSIVVSGEPIARPCGQTMPAGAAPGSAPRFGPSTRLDYELELGVFVGPGNPDRAPIGIDAAEDHVFGVCLLNDWSARDIQAWEYQPLGPFLSKNFGTTISPWVVTLDALAPYRAGWSRPEGDPQPLPYLSSPHLADVGALDIRLEVLLSTPKMEAAKLPPQSLAKTSYRHAYWTVAQLVAHHTINGCNLRPGDLLGTGTLSGPTESEAGALIEQTSGGKKPITLASGETRTFLEDGDTLILRGWCERDGHPRIGLGEASGRIAPARGC
jgi:fumarylacetoacetase